jgi:hypothetical protein
MATILSFLRAFRNLMQDETFRVIVGLATGLLITGTVVYMLVEHWSPLDALYFSVVTLATVGYGDLAPQSDVGKAFTIVFVLAGVGIIVALASRIVDGMVSDRAERLHRRGGPMRPTGPDDGSPDPAAAEVPES